MWAFQEWFTPLIVFPIWIPISTPSLADSRRFKMGLNLFRLSIVLLNCTSNAVKVESKVYDWTLSRESSWWKWLSAYLSDNPELQSWNCIDEIRLEVCWGVLSISEAIEAKIDLHFVFFCNSETRCFQRSSNLMAASHKGSSSETCPQMRTSFHRECLW